MLGNWVLVHALDGVEPFRFWRGWDEEQAALKAIASKKRRATAKPGAAPTRRVRQKQAPGQGAADGPDASAHDGEHLLGEAEEQEDGRGVGPIPEMEEAEDEEILLFGEDPNLLDAGIEAEYANDVIDDTEVDLGDVQAQTDGLGLVEEAAHAEGISEPAAPVEHDASRIPEAAAPADLPPRAYIRAPRVIEGAEAPPAARAVGRVPVLPDVSVAHGAYGDIRYNPLSESFIAVCKQAHGDCRRSRTCKAAKTLGTDRLAAQGRPIGLLAAWLETGALRTTDEAHKKAITSKRMQMLKRCLCLNGPCEQLSQRSRLLPPECVHYRRILALTLNRSLSPKP